MSRWFRHYSGMMRDEKLVSAAVKSKQPVERVVWVWGAILESASEVNDGGRYELDAAEVAYFLRADEGDIRAIFDALTSSGRVADGSVVHWRDRQYESDGSAKRQAALRERKKTNRGGGDGEKGEGDAQVTSPRRHVTPPDTDTDTELREDKSSLSRGDGFSEFQEAYPKRDGAHDWAKAKEAYYRIIIETPPDRLIAAAKAYADWCRKEGKAGTQFVKSAKAWLETGLWKEWEPKAAETVEVPMGVLVKCGTPQWDAWQAVKKTSRSPRYDGWWFPTEWPPGAVQKAVEAA